MAFNKSGASYLKMCLHLSLLSFPFLFFHSLSLPRPSLRCVAGRSRGLAQHHFGQTFSLSLSLQGTSESFSLSRACTKHDEGGICSNSGRILRQYLCFQVAVPVACACVLAWWKCMAAAFKRGEKPGGGFSGAPHLSF